MSGIIFYGTTGQVLQRWDDDTRTYTQYDSGGNVSLTRPYGNVENADADARVAAALGAANEATLRSRATQALQANADYLAVASPTNAQVVAQVRALTQECSALIRIVLRALDSTS